MSLVGWVIVIQFCLGAFVGFHASEYGKSMGVWWTATAVFGVLGIAAYAVSLAADANDRAVEKPAEG